MKKILALILTLAIVSYVPISASAAQGDQTITEGESAASTITYTHPSEYIVNIPYTINFSEEYRFSATKMNLAPDEYLLVTITNLNENGKLLFTHDNYENKSFEATPVVRDIGADLSAYDLPNESVALFFSNGVSSYLFMNWELPDYTGNISAGTYTSIAEFTVELYSK